MSRKWTNDAALINSLAANLFEVLPVFPKRLIRVDELVRVHHMPLSHIQILIMLSREDLSIGQISDRLGIAKPNITPLIDTLRDGGLVERIRDEQDRRIVNVHLLPAGEEKLSAICEDVAGQIVQWKGSFSRSEIKELNSALASLIRFAGAMEG